MGTADNDKKVAVPEHGIVTANELKQILTVREKIADKSPALKATLFGKFYEIILEQCFIELGFESLSPKRAQWQDDVQKPMTQRGYNFDRVRDQMIRDKLPTEALSLVQEMEESLNETIKTRKVFRPDFLLKRNNKYYIVEAKSWPEWRRELDWKGTVLDVADMPQILASYVRHEDQRLKLDGFILVWYSRSEDHDSILRTLRSIVEPLGLTFELYYIDELIPPVASKAWFQEVVLQVRKDVLAFLDSVKRGQPVFRD